MVDIAPIHVSNLLKSLSDATSIVSKNNGPTQQVCDKLEHLANNFDDFGLSLPIDHLPSQLWSGRFGDQPPRTAYVVASDGLGLDLNLVAADILQQFTRKDHVDAARRRVYMSARNSKIASDNTVALDYGAALKSGESAIWDFAEATAESSLKQNEMLERQRAAAQAHTQALNESRETADRLGQANARLQSDLEEANAAREAMSNVFDMVEAHLSRSRSNKRGEPALALPSQMPATDSNLLKDVYSIVKANRATLSSIDETLKRRSKRKDDPPNPQPKEDDIAPSNAPMVWLKEMLVVGGVAAALVVIALLFWFNLDDFLRLVRSVV
jgi:vacuolar-type H+-ATPase subunit E/Vma4